MTQQQYLLADKILRLMVNERKIWSREAFSEIFVISKKFEQSDLFFVTERLIADGFLDFHLHSKVNYLITHKGESAVKIGLENFFSEIERNEYVNELRAKNSYILLIVSVVLSSIGIIISLIALLLQLHS